MTRLYYENEYLRHFNARITAVHELEAGTAELFLSETAFYPEGGGQPGDKGSIAGVKVLDTQKRPGPAGDDDIAHIVKPADLAGDTAASLRTRFETGTPVDCEIDWDHRYDYMQQHTGQHLISAVAYREFGADTVAVHQGEEYTTVEFAVADMDASTIRAIEDRCHEYVDAAMPVHSAEYDESEIAALDLRREPKVSGRIRIVSIADYDRVACGGVHTHSTGELVLLHCIGTERIRGRVRSIWKIGRRAREDYRQKSLVIADLVDRLSAPLEKLSERVSALEESRRQMQYELEQDRRRRGAELATRALRDAATINRDARITTLSVALKGEHKTVFRALGEQLAQEGEESLLAVCTNEAEGKLQWIIVARGIALDQKKLRSEYLPHIAGKGGGRPPIFQGVGEKPEGQADFVRAVLQEA